MRNLKHNQIDLGQLQRKHGVQRKKSIHYHLLSSDSKFVRKAKRVKLSAQIFLKTFNFALSGLLLIFAIQGLVYLSSAKNATGEILGAATAAYGQLDSAGKNLSVNDLAAAQNLFTEASKNIAKASDRLNDYKLLTWVAPQASSAHHVLVGSGFLSEAGGKLTEAMSLFGEIKVTSEGVEGENFNQKISSNKKLLVDSRGLIMKSLDEFSQADSIPADYEGAFTKAQEQLNQLRGIIDNLIKIEDLYLTLFTGEKTYLLVFQNYDETRATGGFLGTYGTLKTTHGSIRDLKIESIYNLDGQITTNIAAPGPFQPEIKKWGIRDSNWFVDFPTSAEKLLYFYEKGKETANGVLALTPRTFVELLQVTGPIEMADYGVILTAENFQDVVQFKTSVDYDKTLNQPKKFLSDFAPILLNRLSELDKNQWIQVMGIIAGNLSNRNIQMYTTNPDAQKQIDDMGFSGKVQDTDYDYLYINNSNLGGTKTDLEISQKATLASKILSDGSVINTLQIIRANNSNENNRNYLRVLVPEESSFVSAVGFDQYDFYKSEALDMRTDSDLSAWDIGEIRSNAFVHEESGKAEFSGWVNTEAQGSKTVTLTYILPFKITVNAFDGVHAYSLLVQKQPGANPLEFIANMDLGELQASWASSGVARSGSLIHTSSNSATDDFWAMVLQK